MKKSFSLKLFIKFTLIILVLISMPRKAISQQFIESAEILDIDSIAIKLSRNDVQITLDDIKLIGIGSIRSLEQRHDILFLKTSEIDLSEIHFIEIKGFGRKIRANQSFR